MNIEYICDHIVKTIHAPIRCYNRDGTLKTIYGEKKINEKNDPIQGNEDLFQKMLALSLHQYPVIYVEDYPVYFAVVSWKEERYMVGPVCTELLTVRDNGESIGEYIARVYHLKDAKIRISYCKMELFGEEILLLHNFLHHTKVTYTELIEKNYINDNLEHSAQQELGRIYFNYQENEKVHNPYDREKREMESIRNGDMEGLRKSLDEVFFGEYGTLSKNKLRAAQNLGICGIVLASRAVIDGGMHAEQSFSICDSYILMLDEATDIGQAEAIVRSAKFKYAQEIQKRNQRENGSVVVEVCKNIIFKNMHNKIEVKEIAEQVHVSANYLSRIFYEKEGIYLKDFINREKIHLTQNLLIYSNYSYEEIAYYFGFCSQSHFGKVFKKWKGMTPKQYRERYGLNEFIQNFD